MNKFGLSEEVLAFIVDTARELDVSKVVLFGSRAKATYSDKSDIDLAVSGSHVQEFIYILEEHCPTLLSFDFVDMGKSMSEELANRIDKEGEVLYEVR